MVLEQLKGILNTGINSSIFNKKILNFYYPNSINPNHITINLDKVISCSFDIDYNEKSVLYCLINNKEKIILGTFDSKKEAEDSLLKIRNKMYYFFTPLKTFLILFFVFLFAYLPSSEQKDFNQNSLNLPITAPQQIDIQPQALINKEAPKIEIQPIIPQNSIADSLIEAIP